MLNLTDRDDIAAKPTMSAYLRPECRKAAQDWIRELYGSQDSGQNAVARALRQENARRTLVNLRTGWTRPTRAG